MRKYAMFHGRARRKEYWFFFLFNMLFTAIAVIVDMTMGTFNDDLGVGLLQGVYALAVLIPSIAVTVRRLHDTDKSGWWIFISLVPLIGGIWLLVLLVFDGNSNENRFGGDPKQDWA